MEMSRKTKQDWIMAGVHLLAEHGASGLTIELLTAYMGLSKGSFYHHFKNQEDYKLALLELWEAEGTQQIIKQIEALSEPSAKLRRLLALAIEEHSAAEVALRAWARQDATVHEFQARIDAQRLAYVQALCGELIPDPARAALMGQVLFLVFIGSQEVLPSLGKNDIQAIYSELMSRYALGAQEEV